MSFTAQLSLPPSIETSSSSGLRSKERFYCSRPTTHILRIEFSKARRWKFGAWQLVSCTHCEPDMSTPDFDKVRRLQSELKRRHIGNEALEILKAEQRRRDLESDAVTRTAGSMEERGRPSLCIQVSRTASGNGRKRVEDILLRHQVWMADSTQYADPADSQIEYRISLRGDALWKVMVQEQARIARVSVKEAQTLVSRQVVDDPSWLQQQWNRNAATVLREWGICSFAANAYDIELWKQYGIDHTGVAFQFQPARDLSTFSVLQEITYSDGERVLENPFSTKDLIDKRMNLLMTKQSEFRFEDEWRLVGGGEANKPKLFAPIALSGVIIGADMSAADRDVLFRTLNERRATTSLQPQIYQARVAGGIVRIDRAK